MEMNKCVCGKTPGMNRWVSEYDGRMQKHRVECECGICGPWSDYETKAIAIWNAPPRAPRWTEYDGTEATLPDEGVQVLIEISFPGHSGVVTFSTVGKRVSTTLNGRSWWERPMADPWEINEGDRWMRWPEGGA